MLDVAIRKPDGTVAIDLGRRAAPPLPVHPALGSVLPDGLRRGSTVTVSGSISLLLALLGTASQHGAWCALVGFPLISAQAVDEYGVDLTRLAVVPAGSFNTAGQGWSTAVGALLDAVDVVCARPPRLVPGDYRRLASRARTKESVLVPYVTDASEWPHADVRLSARAGQWIGLGDGHGRLRARRVAIHAEGKGTAARPRDTELWLPADNGGVEAATALADVIDVRAPRQPRRELPQVSPADRSA